MNTPPITPSNGFFSSGAAVVGHNWFCPKSLTHAETERAPKDSRKESRWKRCFDGVRKNKLWHQRRCNFYPLSVYNWSHVLLITDTCFEEECDSL